MSATSLKHYTPAEIELHNSPTDLWLSWLGNVYDLTPLAEANKGNKLLIPILKHAGRDVSHWFNPKTSDLKKHINPLTEISCPYTPAGRFLDVPPPLPRLDWDLSITPWWANSSYFIGLKSQKTRKIRIVNTLTKDEHVIEVCSEDKITSIQDRYLPLNAHAKGYMWKRLGSLLDMNLTLEENGIKDETETFEKLGLNEDDYLPTIHLYFSDDLTIS